MYPPPPPMPPVFPPENSGPKKKKRQQKGDDFGGLPLFFKARYFLTFPWFSSNIICSFTFLFTELHPERWKDWPFCCVWKNESGQVFFSELQPWKLTWHWTIFNRKYMFIHGGFSSNRHVSFRGGGGGIFENLGTVLYFPRACCRDCQTQKPRNLVCFMEPAGRNGAMKLA